MRYFSMFSGIGGFEYGLEQATKKWQSIGYSEIDKYAIAIYRYHYPKHKNYGNATTLNVQKLPNFDLLIAGFPCQAFSIAGKRQGFDDTRGTLFFEIARVLTEKRPQYFLLENVKGLLSNDKGQTFQTILGILSDIGYEYQWQVLNSKNFGVPQNRERVFIIGHIRGECRPEVFPIGERSTTFIKESISEFDRSCPRPQFRVSDSERARRKIQSRLNIRRLTPIECERLQGFPDNWTKYGIIDGKKVEISDTQRYKCLGNAVTTNVITEIVNTWLKKEKNGL